MDKENESLMAQYGITCEQKTVYHYKQYQYDHLKDAIKFAQQDQQAQHSPAQEAKPIKD